MNAKSDIDAQLAVRDPVAERAERQLRAMEQLGHIGLGLARALHAQVCEGGPMVMRGDPALLFARITRAVRQCMMLETRIAEALREWLGLSEAEREARRVAFVANTPKEKAEAAAEVEVLDEMEGGSRRGLDIERGETERGERAERFWADSYVIEDEGSFVDIVTKVCHDLGVTPDWSGWSEDGPGDLVVKPDGAASFSRVAEWESAPGRWPTGRMPQQRGPPS